MHRLEQLLQIGNLGGTEVGGAYYFHTRREGTQNQPVLYVRKGVDGKDEVLVDVNAAGEGWHGRARLVGAIA